MNKNVLLLRNAALTLMASAICFTACKKDDNGSTSTPPTTTPPVTTPPVTNPDTFKVAKAGGKSVVYVEVNNESMLNVAKYTLKDSGQQLFDIAIIFAANVNYDTVNNRAILYYNQQVTSVINNVATQVAPLQKKGIKVLLSVLGNHMGAGISNFTSRASAHDFAVQLSTAVTANNLDGIDFDDEYADYGKYNTGQPNDSSFTMLVDELRQLMPSKLITMYYYGPAAQRLSYNGKNVGDMLDYSWNAIYGTFNTPTIPGMPKSNLSPAAVSLSGPQATTQTKAASLATSTKNGSYGVYMWYNLTSTDQSGYMSAATQILYNDSVKYNP
ncbi:endo-beta-N-acetylglucosaminidase H [Taibaiella soli]|uniref:Chitinase n=1 Tax=Taibaiella soli TaxID=1649169 RepID=A0A2W2AHK1_9BACT|nr:endo-beta-N-acetylglucosaminidase H [Taibaiella soli]PZF71700.1 chitinase [Taibaiella soli]